MVIKVFAVHLEMLLMAFQVLREIQDPKETRAEMVFPELLDLMAVTATRVTPESVSLVVQASKATKVIEVLMD